MARGSIVAMAVAVTTVGLGATACGGEGSGTSDTQDLLKTVAEAQKKGDGKAFASHFTDKGLEEIDNGSREDIVSGKASINEDGYPTDIDFVDTQVDGDKATLTVDVSQGIVRIRAKFSEIKQDDNWIIDGFEYLGGAPAGKDVPTIEINALNYKYELDTSQLSSGNFAVNMKNSATDESHEMILLSVPAGASTEDLVAKIATADPQSGEVPDGYALMGFLGFAPPSGTASATLATKLDAGHYAIVCFLPTGGFNDAGEPNDPNGVPHFTKGMITDFTVS